MLPKLLVSKKSLLQLTRPRIEKLVPWGKKIGQVILSSEFRDAA